MENIEFKGREILNDEENKTADKLFAEYYPKIQRKIKNMQLLKVHIKEYKKEGKGKKYSINVSIIAPTRSIKANASDWDFARTVHKVLKKIESEIESMFYVSDQHKR